MGSISEFRKGFKALQKDVHRNAIARGWWETDRNDGELLALIHAEVSEALEALRRGNPQDPDIPQFSNAEVELADVIIRIMDIAEARGWDIAKALTMKHEFNQGRSYKHGGKLF